jgi:hypothetical protein
VEFWEDRYEEQLDRCGGAVTVTAPVPDPATALDELISSLGDRIGHDPMPANLALLAERLKERPTDRVEVNPYLNEHRHVDPTAQEWAAVLRAADELRARLGG